MLQVYQELMRLESRIKATEEEIARKELVLSKLELPPLSLNSYEISEGFLLKFYHLTNTNGGYYSYKKKQCPLWESVWGTSIIFSGYLYQAMMDYEDSVGNVLEIGGGLGLSSLAMLMSSKPDRIIMTDLVNDALKIFKMSLRENASNIPDMNKISTTTLDWNKLDNFKYKDIKYDMIIGSDVLFGNWCVAPVVNTLEVMLKPSGIALIADPYRLNDGDLKTKLLEHNYLVEINDFKDTDIKKTDNFTQKYQGVVKINKVKLIIIQKPPLVDNKLLNIFRTLIN